jgi:hypothetical protein
MEGMTSIDPPFARLLVGDLPTRGHVSGQLRVSFVGVIALDPRAAVPRC